MSEQNRAEVDMSKLSGITLVSGFGDGQKTACIMSAVTILRGMEFGDTPVCVAPEVRSLAIRGNDASWWRDDKERTRVLLPILPELLDTETSNKEIQQKRLRLIVLTACRVFAAKAMDSIKLTEQAAALRGILDTATYEEIRAAARAAADAADAADAAADAADADAAYAAAADAAAADAAYAAAADADAYARANLRNDWLTLLRQVCAIR